MTDADFEKVERIRALIHAIWLRDDVSIKAARHLQTVVTSLFDLKWEVKYKDERV